MAINPRRAEEPRCLALWRRVARKLDRPAWEAVLGRFGVSRQKVAGLRAQARRAVTLWEALWGEPSLRPSLRKLDRQLAGEVQEVLDAQGVVERIGRSIERELATRRGEIAKKPRHTEEGHEPRADRTAPRRIAPARR